MVEITRKSRCSKCQTKHSEKKKAKPIIEYNQTTRHGGYDGRKEFIMYYLVQYEGSSVYEPAEGGYYIPILEESAVSTCKYGYKHALRAFKQAVEDMTEIYGEPDVLTKKRAHWTTGRYIGDDVELHIENEYRIGCHEVKYYGYC